MKIALQGTTLLIKEADNVQFAVIKSWNKMRWDRKTQLLTGTADMELLDKLASIVQLPTSMFPPNWATPNRRPSTASE